jgi:carbon-monoxide dehydrogenase catalytic subunit
MERSISPDSILMIKAAQAAGITTAWERYEAQLPQCGFGETGLCCRHCLQGPCRIDPFGVTGPKAGICGATADTIVARGLARSIAGGTSSHSAHAKHLVHTLLKWSRGQAPDYSIRDKDKFYKVLDRVGIARDGKSDQELAGELAKLAPSFPSAKSRPSGSRRRSRQVAWQNLNSLASSRRGWTRPWRK